MKYQWFFSSKENYYILKIYISDDPILDCHIILINFEATYPLLRWKLIWSNWAVHRYRRNVSFPIGFSSCLPRLRNCTPDNIAIDQTEIVIFFVFLAHLMFDTYKTSSCDLSFNGIICFTNGCFFVWPRGFAKGLLMQHARWPSVPS